MQVVPLTLVVSLCLAFTFIVFFAREQRRRRFASNESESLLPLADETAHVVTSETHASRCSGNGACACEACPRHRHAPAPSPVSAA